MTTTTMTMKVGPGARALRVVRLVLGAAVIVLMVAAFCFGCAVSTVQEDDLPDPGPVVVKLDLTAAPPALPGTDMARFQAGMALFSHAFAPAEGLGPDYNGASCAGCHFYPMVGGSGGRRNKVVDEHPRFVNFTEQDLSGYAGTLPPPLYLLSALDGLVPEPGADAALGIAGVVPLTGHHRPQDEPGIFGRKGQAESLAAFNQGAARGEVGLCVAPISAEGTGCAPNEAENLSATQMGDLDYFVRHLAAPASTTPPPGGQAAFAAIGCAVCHAGPLGTDLAAHDLGPAFADGIATSQLSASHWRTAPLIYVRGRPSFLHDGRAASVDQAVRAHGGEAELVINNYAALADYDRNAVVGYVLSR